VSDLLSDLALLRKKEVATLRNTRPFNLLGLPTITVPCGATRAGLPIGVQVTAADGAEEMVMRVGALIANR
jgi:Asp-tRNA(Asn)/Glu-tRNA(Gln) amidotransferase A subunit family amidase